ncbi:MAG: SoxR reducing system RseC family protein, partial [Peptostreptococcus porci]|nr:SoxR reducing system RseC family protein [Peptostreptococcus porci]
KCIGASNSESQDIIVEVQNKIGAKKGQYVEVSMEHIDVMRAIFIVYGIPLIALIIGSVASFYLLENIGYTGNKLEILSFVFGLVLMGISYIFIKKKDNSFRESRRYMPTVTRIVGDIKPENVLDQFSN